MFGWTVAELKDEAKKLGIQGFAQMKKDELIEAIEEAKKTAEANSQDQEQAPKTQDQEKSVQQPKQEKTRAPNKVPGKYHKFQKGN